LKKSLGPLTWSIPFEELVAEAAKKYSSDMPLSTVDTQEELDIIERAVKDTPNDDVQI